VVGSKAEVRARDAPRALVVCAVGAVLQMVAEQHSRQQATSVAISGKTWLVTRSRAPTTQARSKPLVRRRSTAHTVPPKSGQLQLVAALA
jgi:hypothetical protein